MKIINYKETEITDEEIGLILCLLEDILKEDLNRKMRLKWLELEDKLKRC